MLRLRTGHHRLPPAPSIRPRHVGLIMDGNRRWARLSGMANPSVGHRVGAEHLGDLLRWLEIRDIHHASVYVLSANNIRKRAGSEIDYLFSLIETVVPQQVRRSGHWRLHVAGDLDLLPAAARMALERAMIDTADRAAHLTLAIGYDPQQEIVEAVRGLLGRTDLPADQLPDAITAALPGGPVKDIDLVIRTSGERRISFFPWQSQRAEIHFSDTMWPAFTEHDLDLALADYARRKDPR